MPKKLSTLSAITTLSTIMLGVGIYFTPYTFAYTGTLVSCISLFSIVFVSCVSNFFLFYSAKAQEKIELSKEQMGIDVTNSDEIDENATVYELHNAEITNPKLSYARIGTSISKWVGMLIEAMRVIVCYSVCLFFHKFICTVIRTNLCHIFEAEESVGLDLIVVSIVSAVLLSLAQIKNINRFSWLASFNVLIILLNSAIIIALSFYLKGLPSATDYFVYKGDFLFSLANFIFALSCQVNIVDVYVNLSNKSLRNLFFISAGAPLVCGLFYGCVGYMGSRLLGKNVLKIDFINLMADVNSPLRNFIIENMAFDKAIVYLIQILALLSLMISFTYVLDVIKQSLSNTNLLKRTFKRTSIALISSLCMLSFTLINLIPSISLDFIFSFIGNVMCIPLAYIFPAMFAMRYKRKNWLVVLFSIVFILLATLFAGFNFIYPFVIDKIANESDSPNLNNSSTLVPSQ